MKLVAITGSIGCGQDDNSQDCRLATIAKIVGKLGYTVFDVDGWVRRLYFKKDFIKVIQEHFPAVAENGQVNKRALRNIVFSDNRQLKVLEGLIHPFLRETLKDVIRKNACRNDIFFIDVALLFEMGWDKYCDFILVADVDYEIQKQRVMNRDKVTAEDFDKINNVQLSNSYKINLADVVVNTDKPKNLLKVEMINIIQGLESADD